MKNVRSIVRQGETDRAGNSKHMSKSMMVGSEATTRGPMSPTATSQLSAKGSRPASIPLVLAAVVALAFAMATIIASTGKGPWIDEFWSVYLGNPHLSFGELLRTRWLLDVNPVPANALYALSARLAKIDDVGALRLILNLPALVFLIAGTIVFWGKSQVRRDFYPLATMLLLGSYDAVEMAADFRAYFWQIVATLVGLQYFHWVFSEKRLLGSGLAHFMAGIAVVLSLNLHFMAAFLTGVAYAVLLVAGWFSGQKKRVVRLTALLCLASILSIALAIVQYQRAAAVLDVRWVTTSTFEALNIYARMAAKILISVAVAATIVFVAIYRNPRIRSALFSGGGVRFSLLIAAAIGLGGVGFLMINLRQPLIIHRYLYSWYALAAVGTALLIVEAIRDIRWATFLIGLAALVMMTSGTASIRNRENWLTGVYAAREMRKECPDTKVVGAPGWRFGSDAHSVTAKRETTVTALSIASIAGDFDVPVSLLDSTTPIRIEPGRCPTLVWVPHIWSVDMAQSAAALLRAGRISVPPGAKASIIHPSPVTLLIRVEATSSRDRQSLKPSRRANEREPLPFH